MSSVEAICFSQCKGKSDTLFWKGGLIVMWLLSVQGLHSNSEGLNTDFKSDLISEPLWYHFFYWFDILSARDSLMRVCSHGLFFLTHAFGKFTCLVFILWFTMVIFFLYFDFLINSFILIREQLLYCDGFCHTSVRIGHRYTCVPQCWTSSPPPSPPLSL